MATISQTSHAIARALTAIRLVHPDVRPAIVAIYRHERGDRRVHFQAEDWRVCGRDDAPDEIHISSVILAEGAENVLRTLLHEAAHSIAAAQEIQDTSRQGRWHNVHSRRLAAEVGLTTEPDPSMGCTTTVLTDQARDRYETVLEELQEAVDICQVQVVAGAGGKGTSKSRLVKATCPGCGRIIRASRQVFGGEPSCGSRAVRPSTQMPTATTTAMVTDSRVSGSRLQHLPGRYEDLPSCQLPQLEAKHLL